MKRIANYITIIAFFTITVMFGAGTLILGRMDLPQKEIPEGKNIIKKSETFINNNFPLKHNWKSLYTNIMVSSGITEFDGIYLVDGKLLKSHEDFNSETIEKTNETINKFAASQKIPVFAMIVPTAAGIYSSKLPSYSKASEQRQTIDDIYLKLDKSITAIDAFYPLYSAKNEYIYYKTSDCWTSFGAYYAYIEAVKKLGFQAVTLSNYDKEYAEENYFGELYQKVYYSGIKGDRINIFRSKFKSPVTNVTLYKGEQTFTAKSVYFKSALKTFDKTDIFMQGDKYEKAVINTNLKDAPRLLIIKGSCANAMVPFLTAHYSQITMIDPKMMAARGKTLAQLADTNEFDQILIMCDISEYCSGDIQNIVQK